MNSSAKFLVFNQAGDMLLSDGIPIDVRSEERMSFDVLKTFGAQTTFRILHCREVIWNARLILEY